MRDWEELGKGMTQSGGEYSYRSMRHSRGPIGLHVRDDRARCAAPPLAMGELVAKVEKARRERIETIYKSTEDLAKRLGPLGL